MQEVKKIVINPNLGIDSPKSYSSYQKNPSTSTPKLEQIKVEKINLDILPVERFPSENNSTTFYEDLNQKLEAKIQIQKFMQNVEKELENYVNKQMDYLEDDYLNKLRLEKEQQYSLNQIEGWNMKLSNYHAIDPFITFIKKNRNQIDPNQLIYYIQMFEKDEFSCSMDGKEIRFSDGSVLRYDDFYELVLYKDNEDIKKKYEDIYLENLKNEEKKLYDDGLKNSYTSVNLFLDFIKQARKDQDLQMLSLYIDTFENHTFGVYKEDSIEFFDGTKIYYDAQGNVVFSNPKLDYKKIVYTSDGTLKYTDDFCLKYDNHNQFMNVTDINGNAIDFFDDVSSYGGSQMDFKKNIDMILEDEQYLDIMQKYYPDADIEDVELFSYALCNAGCGYVSLANSLYVYYEDKPDKFYETYGFPMYTVDEKGGIVSNVNYLTYDIALYRYKDFPIKEVYGNVNTINKRTLNDGALDDTQEIKGKFSGTSYFAVNDFFKEYVKDKDLKFSLKMTTKMDKKTYESLIAEGKQVIIGSAGWDLYEDKDQDGIYETLYEEDGGGHAMYLTAIDENNNFVVSSWGKEYKFEFDDEPWKATMDGGLKGYLSHDYVQYEIISFEEIKHD